MASPTNSPDSLPALKTLSPFAKMTKLNFREAAMQLITVSHLFFGFVFSADTSVSGWALQSFVTEPDIQPPVFDINKTGTTADVSVFYH